MQVQAAPELEDKVQAERPTVPSPKALRSFAHHSKSGAEEQDTPSAYFLYSTAPKDTADHVVSHIAVRRS